MWSNTLLRPAVQKLAFAALIASTIAASARSDSGGVGDAPVSDPGWPKGASEIFNAKGRIAWWESSPMYSGRWQAQFRGDGQALNEVLDRFAKLPANEGHRVVVHDGVGHSLWLNPYRQEAKTKDSQFDWMLTTWQSQSGHHIRFRDQGPVINPFIPNLFVRNPPSQIDVYADGNIRWTDVVISKDVNVVDMRSSVHGFTTNDGVVFQGAVTDIATKAPIAGAIARLERVERDQTETTRFRFVEMTTTVAKDGRWTLRNVPEGWYRVVIEAPGFVPRVAGYARTSSEPCWTNFSVNMGKYSIVEGIVHHDSDGAPLSDVEVRLSGIDIGDGRFETPKPLPAIKTDKDGRFRSTECPAGKAIIQITREGYCRPGEPRPVTIPSNDIDMGMMTGATVEVTVDFGALKNTGNHQVVLDADNGIGNGTRTRTATVDKQGKATFKDLPPDIYRIWGGWNLGINGQSHTVEVDARGGQIARVKVMGY